MPEFQGHFEWGEMPPFAEAVAWFLDKEILTREDFNKLAAEMKGKAFTAARVLAADELQAVYDAVLTAIESGQTLRDFVLATEEILTRPWHRETVFRTNVLSSYGAGHWEQAQEIRALRPYARYSAVMDGRTRPSHAALHGLIYPLDHPFWRTYWPPWDYNCRCFAVTLSQWEVEQGGLQVRQGGTGHLPRPQNDFVSPAAGGRWQPDYGKYAPELGAALQEAAGKAIYD